MLKSGPLADEPCMLSEPEVVAFKHAAADEDTHLQALVLLERLSSDVMAAVQVVRDGEADPVGLVAGLQLQHGGARVHKAHNVS